MPKTGLRASLTPWENPLTRALRDGKVCLGALSISFGGASGAQIFARAGYSWLYIDLEHTQLSLAEVRETCLAAKIAGIVPVVGPAGIAQNLISGPLDAGAMGVIAPHVETVAEARMVVNSAKYAPIGKRGLVYPGIHSYFETPDGAEWIEVQNREILAAVKVESVTAIENIDAIAAVPGLDAIMVGPGDLSATMGIAGQTGHKRVRDAIHKVLKAAKRNGISAGPHVGTAEEAARWADEGATFMSYRFDGELLLRASTEAIDRARDVLGGRMA